MIGYEDIDVDRSKREITITFRLTNQYFHIRCRDGNIRELCQEPPLHSLPKQEQHEVTLMAQIAYAMIFEPEDLSK